MDYLQRITSHQQLQMQEIWSNVQVVEDNYQPRTSYHLRMKDIQIYRYTDISEYKYLRELTINRAFLLIRTCY